MGVAATGTFGHEVSHEAGGRVGIVVALAREARALAPDIAAGGALQVGSIHMLSDAMLAVSGMGWEAAAAAARRLAQAGATALASVGTAGALDLALETGAIMLPEEVVVPEGDALPTHARWWEALAHVLPRHQVYAGRLLTTRLPLGLRLDKAIARRETACVAVDMESAAIAGVAAEAGLPFIALRVIVDTAGEDLPGAVLAASAGRELSIARLLAGLACAPWEVRALMRLAARFRTACAVLAGIGEPGLPARQALIEVSRERAH